MIYGAFQYYKDELNGWKRAIAFHKATLREFICQLGALSTLQNASLANGKIGDRFSDQMMGQENEFDYVGNLIETHHQRLDHAIGHRVSPADDAVSAQQDLLRAKMKNLERQFLQAKYSCSLFLSALVSQPKPVSRTKRLVHAGAQHASTGMAARFTE